MTRNQGLSVTAETGALSKTWFKIGCLSFGGAAAQIALLHREFVEERRLIDERSFLHALNLCMLLPGPEAQQLATYIGWRLSGVRGGIVAGWLFVLPGALVMLGLSILYVYFGAHPSIITLFLGLKCAVLSLILHAVIRLSRRALKTLASFIAALIAFFLMGLTTLSFPLIILATALFAFVFNPLWPNLFGPQDAQDQSFSSTIKGSEILKSIALWLIIWFLPLGMIALTLGIDHRLADIGLFFAKLASLSFGGAYALLAWLAQTAVETKSWLSSSEMADGLGLAETTPGPTILVTEFVGFLAAFRASDPLHPLIAGCLGAVLTVWMTFAPSFLFIFAGAPLFEHLRSYPRLGAAFQAITSVIVGVIAWVGVWFALHLLFASVTLSENGLLRLPLISWDSFQPEAAGLSALAAVMFFILRLPLGAVLVLTILAGFGVQALGLS